MLVKDQYGYRDGPVSVAGICRYGIFGDRSHRYREALEICGIDEPASDMARRISLLEECVRAKADTPEGVLGILGRYYLH